MKNLDPFVSTDPTFEQRVRASVPGMAHFAGTGPAGKTCGQCQHLTIKSGLGGQARNSRLTQLCAKFHTMMGVWGMTKIPDSTRACKYFQPQPPRPKKRGR